MSKHARSRPSHGSRFRPEYAFLPVRQELPEGYVEVELTGVSLGRLAGIYAVLVRGAWSSTLASLRSMMRPAAPTEV